MNIKLTTFFVLCFLIVVTTNAQTVERTYTPHYLGFNAGSTSGIGISYRYLPKKIGVQCTAIAYKRDAEWNDIMGVWSTILEEDDYSPREDEKFVSVGLTGLAKIKEAPGYNLMAYVSNHYLSVVQDDYYNIGAGVGFTTTKKVIMSMMVGFGAYDVLDDMKITASLEFSVFYHFRKIKK